MSKLRTPWKDRPAYLWKPEPKELDAAQRAAEKRGETLLELISRAVRTEVRRIMRRRR